VKRAERRILVLQGGGAGLGAYQAGVHEAPAAAALEPQWLAGVSHGQTKSPGPCMAASKSGSSKCSVGEQPIDRGAFCTRFFRGFEAAHERPRVTTTRSRLSASANRG
jgi:hypothetical protein